MIAKVTVLSILLLLLSAVSSSAEDVKVTVQGVTSIANTDDNFVCATIDWWPINKCDYNQCPWGKSGVLNLVFFSFFLFSPCYIHEAETYLVFWVFKYLQDLKNKILSNAIKGKYSVMFSQAFVSFFYFCFCSYFNCGERFQRSSLWESELEVHCKIRSCTKLAILQRSAPILNLRKMVCLASAKAASQWIDGMRSMIYLTKQGIYCTKNSKSFYSKHV